MFGRRKDDEDPFAALKDGGTYQSTPSALPELGLGEDAPAATPPASPFATSSSPTSAPTTAPAPPAPQRRGQTATPVRFGSSQFGGSGFRLGALWRVVAVAIVSVVIGSIVVGASHTVHSIKIPSFQFNTGGVTTPGPGGTGSSPSAPRPRPVNYLTPRGLRAGLADVARLVHGARLTLLRVDSRTLSVYATRPNGRTTHVYLSPSVTFVSPGVSPGERPLPARQISAGVLGSLIAQLHRRFGVPRSRIDYVVVSSPSGQPPRWVLFVRNAAHQGYVAPLTGGSLTRI